MRRDRRQVGCQASSGVSGVKWGVRRQVGCQASSGVSMDVNSPVYLQHASLCAFHRALGDYITHRPSDSPKLKTVQYQHHATDITGVRLVLSDYFQQTVEQGRNSCGTVCRPPRQAYVIFLDVDCEGSDLIVDRPKAPTKTNYIHHAPFSFPSHSGIRWGESATLKSSESLLIRWVRDWLVITLSHQHPDF